MGTKNNPKNRKVVEKKKYQGKEVEPVFYHGVNAGHGRYMAAKFAGGNSAQLIADAAGKPLMWEELA